MSRLEVARSSDTHKLRLVLRESSLMHYRASSQFAWICLLSAVVLMMASVRTSFGQQSVAVRGKESRPIAVWPSGPLEVIAAFDRPIDRALAQSLVGKNIPFFESMTSHPGRPLSPKPIGTIPIAGTRLADDGRTMILATDPHPRAAHYVLPLATVDHAQVTYDLSGVEAIWSEEEQPSNQPRWSGWWPRLDSDSLRLLSRGSKRHEEGLGVLSKRGRLVLSTLVRVPPGTVTLRLEGSVPIAEAIFGDVQAEPGDPASKEKHQLVTLASECTGDSLFLTVTLQTGAADRLFGFKASYRVGKETTDHSLGSDRLMLPWVPIALDSATAAPLVVPDLAGGDPARGQTLFFGDQARCSQCHVFRGQGGKVGPDLTDIGGKGRAEIYRSIAAPSATIEPVYTSYTVATKDGQVVVGVVRAEGNDAVKVTDTNARATVIPRKQIEQIRPSATSVMPVGLTGALGIDTVRDLIAYLTSRQQPQPQAKPQR
jgi:putative heme-binding domain-containing protein